MAILMLKFEEVWSFLKIFEVFLKIKSLKKKKKNFWCLTNAEDATRCAMIIHVDPCCTAIHFLSKDVTSAVSVWQSWRKVVPMQSSFSAYPNQYPIFVYFGRIFLTNSSVKFLVLWTNLWCFEFVLNMWIGDKLRKMISWIMIYNNRK